MKKILLLFALIALPCMAGDHSIKLFVLGCRDSFYAANSNKLQKIQLAIWDKDDTRPNRNKVDQGWMPTHKISDTNVTGRIYVVSFQQAKSSLDAAEIAKFKAWTDDNPGVMFAGTFDVTNTLASKGWAYTKNLNPSDE